MIGKIAQLRSRFRLSDVYLGLYHRRELIAHELAHVGRMLYQEPQFEEILAYQSSASRWRRWLGPLFQSSKESLFFVILLAISIMADFALLSTGVAGSVAWWIKGAPLLLIALVLIRLAYRQDGYQRCLKQLCALYPQSEARHVLYRLRDSEIKQFGKMTPFEIRDFIDTSSARSFRWKFLKKLYEPILPK
jgi:hypothetical protein